VTAVSATTRAPRGVLARNLPRPGADARPEFFYMHGDYNGGGFYCLALAGHIGKDQPFYALAPPGHDGGPIPPGVHAMADVQLEMLRAVRPHGPYRLGGFCNGGLVAYEMARRLVAAGERVERLILVAPVLPLAGGRLARLGDRARALRQYYVARTRAMMRLSLAEQLRYARGKAMALLGRGAAPPIPMPRTGASALPPGRAELRDLAYQRITRPYLPEPFAGDVDIIWPENERRRVRGRSTRAWRRAAGRVRVRMVPGEHLTCIRERVGELGAAIRACLHAETRSPR
jgi:thioesterase domain-containing protein